MITNHVVSFETAKKLRAAGFKQEMYFVYVNGFLMPKEDIKKRFDRGHDIKSYCAAPLFTEIWTVFPSFIHINGRRLDLQIDKYINTKLHIRYVNHAEPKVFFSDSPSGSLYSDEPCEAAAQMWLKLKDEEII